MKKLLNISLLLLLTFKGYSQVDSIFGTYVTATFGNSPKIILYPDSTFGYKSAIDVGGVSETKGSLKFVGDTIIFKYKESINPVIKNIEKRFNAGQQKYLITIMGAFDLDQHISLYINNPFTQHHRSYSFENNTLTVDSINLTDTLYIHFGKYSWTPINLNLEKFNEYTFYFDLPATPTIYYLTQEKALLKNGLLFFSLTTDGIPYYNKNVYVKKKDTKRIRNLIWTRRNLSRTY